MVKGIFNNLILARTGSDNNRAVKARGIDYFVTNVTSTFIAGYAGGGAAFLESS
jgi:hypothetical protein